MWTCPLQKVQKECGMGIIAWEFMVEDSQEKVVSKMLSKGNNYQRSLYFMSFSFVRDPVTNVFPILTGKTISRNAQAWVRTTSLWHLWLGHYVL
jgi:hypothetical protein